MRLQLRAQALQHTIRSSCRHGGPPAAAVLPHTHTRTGYGSHAIGDCWLPAWLVGIQCILAVLLEAIFLGIIFAKISHPKGRSRTIIISECSCIARRDGILKL